MTLTVTVILAVALDYLLGEPRSAYHPLCIFGKYANAVENCLLRPGQSAACRQIAGGFALLVSLTPWLAWLYFLPEWPPVLQAAVNIASVYFCIAARSLKQHAMAVHQALLQSDLPLARLEVGKIVSRQTENMDTLAIRRAAIESVLENGADAVFAPLFWFLALGPFGALLYRFSNTLDAMWGYKNRRYLHFGRAAARFDDLLNWIPARLTALSYALLGNTRKALRAWHSHAHLLDSPNAGPVMSAGAGALALQLGGPACYHGRLKQKPWFGGERMPENQDIPRACGLIYRTLALWLFAVSLGDSLA